jgi:glycolate oxidase FAD binding subunit
LTEAMVRFGEDAVRGGTPSDAIDGVVPRLVMAPASPERVSAILEWAFAERQTVVVRGSGTKIEWGPVPRAIDVLLSTARLNRIVAHRHGDLTATIQAGATLDDVNRSLGTHRQWIPLDPPSAGRATIGGLVATNDSGPRRHRYGSPRDLIIGVEFVRADGRLAKGGGIVVKNVAGYDLPRLLTGSFGSLGVIVTATFKLYPLTAASGTVVVDVPTLADVTKVAREIAASPLTPTALEFATHPWRLLVRFESIEASVEQQSAKAHALVRSCGFDAETVSGAGEDAVWGNHARVWADPGATLLKVSVLPTAIADALVLLERTAGNDGWAAAGRAGAGVFVLRIDGDIDRQERVIGALRSSIPQGQGSAVIIRGPAELRNRVDVWGPTGDALALMKAIKHQFDPHALLSPGRGPGGI